jgi:cobalt-zinc-cadmium efflux system protein
MALQAVPPGVDLRAIHDYLARVPGIGAVHDLHVWAMSTTENALTVHLVTAAGAGDRDALLETVTTGLSSEFSIRHATVQVESPRAEQMVFRARGD